MPRTISFLVLMLTGPSILAAAEPSQARVEARLKVAEEGGGFVSSSQSRAILSLGESTELLVGVHRCAPFAGMARPDSMVWHFSVTLDEAREDLFALSYDWSRVGVLSSGELDDSDTEARRVTLRHGEETPVDLARLRGPAGPRCDVFVELGVSYAVSPELEDRIVHHELWLIHTDPEGHETSTKLDLSGEQGEALPFTHEPLKIELPSLRPAGGGKVALVSRLSGTVRSWVTAEEELLLVVDTDLSLRALAGASVRTAASTGEGTKKFRVKPGEAVKIVIPSFRGVLRLPAPADDETPPPGVRLEDAQWLIHAQDLLGGHRLALLVKAAG